MAVKIRLARAGAKKHAYYHVVATDSTSKRDGKFLEAVGAYDPSVTPTKLEFNSDRLEYWLKVGAKPTETVAALLRRHRRQSQQPMA